MTTDTLDQATVSLAHTLAQTPTQQLVILITQHPSLPTHTSRVLRISADEAVQRCMPPMGRQADLVKSLADTLRRLIERGDPSQARRLAPGQACLVDLALCCDARDILARLMDKTAVDELLKAAIAALERAYKESVAASSLTTKSVVRAAYILGRLLYCLPRFNQQQTLSLSSRRTTASAKGILDVRKCVRLLSLLNKAYAGVESRTKDDATQFAIDKLCLIEATWQIIERYCDTHMQIAVQEIDSMLEAIQAKSTTDKATVLRDASLASDVSVLRPLLAILESRVPKSSFVQVLRSQQHTQSKKRRENQQDSIQDVYLSIVQGAKHEDLPTTPSKDVSDRTSLVDLIYGILPYWREHGGILKSKLSSPSYADQSDEMIVQMLMDEGETAVNVKQAQQTEYERAMEILSRRGNVFENEPLDVIKPMALKGKGKQEEEEISSDLKAFILARASAPDSDDEDAVEWEPFSSHAAEVGFEEELDDTFDGRAQVRNVPLGDSYSDTSQQDDLERAAAQEEGEGDGALAGVGHTSAGRSADMQTSRTNSTAVAAAERAAEQILVTAWKEKGESLFAKDARKTASRNALLANLANTGGITSKKWDDQLVESWGTMFSRNPRKDKLLASIDDPLRTGNPNRIHKTIEEECTFGPDRGRGGRVLRTDDGGAGHRGRGSGHRGRGRGGTRGNRSRK